MQNSTLDLNTLLVWSPAKRVNTAKGWRDLKTAVPTEDFWNVYRDNKQSLKDAGISCSKDRFGQWEVCWWQL